MDDQTIDLVVAKLLEHCDGGKVLDLGAGEGRHALELARRGFEVTAVDGYGPSLAVLEAHARHEGLEIETIEADMVTFTPNEYYDVVMCLAAVSLLDSGQIEGLVRKMQEHTAPGGWNVILADAPHEEDSEEPGHAKALPWVEWYEGWKLEYFEESIDSTESKPGGSDNWLVNRMVRLLVQKENKE